MKRFKGNIIIEVSGTVQIHQQLKNLLVNYSYTQYQQKNNYFINKGTIHYCNSLCRTIFME